MKFFKSKQEKTQVVEAPIAPPVSATPVAEKPTPAPKPQAETLMAHLAKIAEDYNQTRAALQQELFAKLDQLNAAQDADQATLAELATSRAELEAQITELQVVDTSELDARVNEIAKQLETLVTQQQDQEAAVTAAKADLAVLKARRDGLQADLAALAQDSQDLTAKLQAETDPLAILNMADAMRTQVEKNATKQQHLQAELEDVDSQYTDQSAVVAAEKAKATELADQLTAQQETQSTLKRRRQTLLDEQQAAMAGAQAKLADVKTRQQTFEAGVAKREQEIKAARQQLAAWFGSTHRVNPLALAEGGEFVFALDTFLPKRADELAHLVTYLLQAGVGKVGLYSSYFDINLQHEIEAWAAEYDIDATQIEVINPLLKLQASDAAATRVPIQLPEATSQSWNADHTELTLQMATAARTLRVRYHTDAPEQISDITYLDGERMFKHSFFDRQGHLVANAVFDDHGALKSEEYYRKDGILALTIGYADGKQQGVEVFDQNGVLRQGFADSKALTQWWLDTAFPAGTRVVGCCKHPDYNPFLNQEKVEAVPYLTEADTNADGFAACVQSVEAAKFIVTNYAAAQGLVQAVDRDVELLQLSNVNLPFQIGSPTVAL